FTIGTPFTSAVLAARDRWSRRYQLLLNWRRGMEREQHPAESLERRLRQPSHGAASKMPFDVELANGKNRGHQQVPEARHDKQLKHIVGGSRDLLLTSEQLGYRCPECERRRL